MPDREVLQANPCVNLILDEDRRSDAEENDRQKLHPSIAVLTRKSEAGPTFSKSMWEWAYTVRRVLGHHAGVVDQRARVRCPDAQALSSDTKAITPDATPSQL
jgi:hypothetical protein